MRKDKKQVVVGAARDFLDPLSAGMLSKLNRFYNKNFL